MTLLIAVSRRGFVTRPQTPAPVRDRVLGGAYEDALRAIANWVDEETAAAVRRFFLGDLLALGRIPASKMTLVRAYTSELYGIPEPLMPAPYM